MLSYLNNFIVPTAPFVVVYPDNENPYKFYCYRTVPHVSRDHKTNDPLFHYTSVQRKADDAARDDKGAGMGWLDLTVDIGPTAEEYKAIEQFILDGMKRNDPLFTSMNTLYPAHKVYSGPKQVVFGSPQWESGSAKLSLFREGKNGEGIFKSVESEEVKPALNGYCHASFTETFKAEGDELMTGFIETQTEDKTTDKIATQGTVWYTLEGAPAFVPALKASIVLHLDKAERYFESLKDQLDKTRSGGITEVWSKNYHSRTDSRGLHSDRKEVEDMIKNARTNGTVTIKIDSFSGLTSEREQEWEDDLMEIFTGTVTKTMLELLFKEEEPVAPDTSQAAAEGSGDSGEYDSSKPDSRTKVTDNELDRPNVHVSYLYTGRKNSSVHVDHTITIEKSCVKMFSDNPQGLLSLDDLTDNQKKLLMTTVEMQESVHENLHLPVSAYAEFGEDGVQYVRVKVKYDHSNPITGKKRYHLDDLLFETGHEAYQFNVTKLRNPDKTFIDTYEYQSKIVYKGQEMYDDEDKGWSPWIKSDSKRLIITYGMLGHLRVGVKGGNFDSEFLKEAKVHLKYLGAPNERDVETELTVSPESGEQVWKCPRHGSSDNRYQYSVVFYYQDGSKFETGPFVDTREKISIMDPFDSPREVDFMIRRGLGVEFAQVEVQLQDGDYVKKTEYDIPEGKSLVNWTWKGRIRSANPPTISYRTTFAYEGQAPQSSGWIKIKNDEPIYINIATDPNEKPDPILEENTFQIITSTIKWDRWLNVIVVVTDDTKKPQTLPVATGTQILPVNVTYSSEGKGAIEIKATFIGTDGSVVNVGPVDCADTFYVLQDPKDGQQ